MILVFGGTTEGRKTVEVLEEAGSLYYYSTKTGEQDIRLHHGQRIDGAMDSKTIMSFCNGHDIRLLIDAAHPFATLLHQTVTDVAEELNLPIIRYERIFPPRHPAFEWIDDYTQVPHDIHSLLATTGVQSISKLKPLETEGIKVYYRILQRQSSIDLAHSQGATDDQLCFYTDGDTIDVKADAILLKESGESGGFQEKVKAAQALGMRIIVLKRPTIVPKGRYRLCDGPHGLRRMVEQILPEFFPLHSGLTTGTCATAAAIAATRRLLYNENLQEVPVKLPDGETISVAVGYGDDYAYCIKEAGDDPDVTDGIEVRAYVEFPSILSKEAPPTVPPRETFRGKERFIIEGGEGVGRFTLPGFDFPPGEPAINKGPRQMIIENLHALLQQHASSSFQKSPSPLGRTDGDLLTITISVPQGAEIARRTFNPRLGIEGGISIIGVSGIVKPFSEEAFIDSIRKCMTVAKASGTDRVVLNSGAKSERFLKERYPTLPLQAFVQYGNYIGETLKMAHELQIPNVTLGVMLGKAVKLAEGQLDTHSRRSTMNPDFIRQMLNEAHCPVDISHITLARELWTKLPADKTADFTSVVISHCLCHCRPLLPDGKLTLLLIDDDGHLYESPETIIINN